MKLLINILLGLCTVLAIVLLILQDLLLPALAGWICVLLRFLAAFSAQLLFRRLFTRPVLRTLPLTASGILAVGGLFLYLTVPSWLGLRLSVFLAHFVMPLLGCGLVWLLYALQPQFRRLRKLLKRRKKKKKKR